MLINKWNPKQTFIPEQVQGTPILSFEIWKEVFKYLGSTSLKNIDLVCKQFKRITSPLWRDLFFEIISGSNLYLIYEDQQNDIQTLSSTENLEKKITKLTLPKEKAFRTNDYLILRSSFAIRLYKLSDLDLENPSFVHLKFETQIIDLNWYESYLALTFVSTVKIYSQANLKLPPTLLKYQSTINGFQWYWKFLFLLHEDHLIRIWNCESGDLINEIPVNTSCADVIQYMPSEKIAMIADGRLLRIWRLGDHLKLLNQINFDEPMPELSQNEIRLKILRYNVDRFHRKFCTLYSIQPRDQSKEV